MVVFAHVLFCAVVGGVQICFVTSDTLIRSGVSGSLCDFLITY